MNGRVEGSLTSNFKVIHQPLVIYFNIFGFYDLNYIENDTNLIFYHIYTSIIISMYKQWQKQCILTTVMYI